MFCLSGARIALVLDTFSAQVISNLCSFGSSYLLTKWPSLGRKSYHLFAGHSGLWPEKYALANWYADTKYSQLSIMNCYLSMIYLCAVYKSPVE